MRIFFPRHSHLFKACKWIASARVVSERQESPELTWLQLRGEDGADRGLWFVFERGQWRLDNDRTRRDW